MKSMVAIEFTKKYYDTIDKNEEAFECMKKTIEHIEDVLGDNNLFTFFNYIFHKDYDFISLEDCAEYNEKIVNVIKDFYGDYVNVMQRNFHE